MPPASYVRSNALLSLWPAQFGHRLRRRATSALLRGWRLARRISVFQALRLLAIGIRVFQALRLLPRGVRIAQALRLLAIGVGIAQALRLLTRILGVAQALRLLPLDVRLGNRHA